MQPISEQKRKYVYRAVHSLILILSAALIVFISYEIFSGTEFLLNNVYMTFQLWVCIFFIIDYFLCAWMSPDPKRYLLRNIGFFIISIPYLNIIRFFDIEVSYQTLYYIRFIPLIRGAWALAIVMNYISTNRIVGILTSYLSILLMVLYFSSLLFFAREQPINPGVPTYWSSLWWCCLQMTTIGSSVIPYTPVGKILSAILSAMGMIMFPLFTVYLTQMVRKYLKK